jgi:nitrate/TMAO reductase-like tetraheme cytochrome c subunit
VKLPADPARRRKWLRAAVQILILLVLLLAVGTVGFIEYSGHPSFCKNCHNMRPYYDSWATSTHNQVPCIRCHYAPGIKAEAMGKLQAANQVVKYVTGAYGTKPWAEIEDAACLRSGCHSERKLEGELSFGGIRFDHEHHLTDLRRGKQLRCTSCHSQIVQGEHLAVTKETCYLCHFRGQPPGEPIAGCTGCHQSPPLLVSDAGFVVDHPQYVEELTSCVSCHEQVTDGSGEADRTRCFSCHNEPERLEQYENIHLIHQVHLAVHNVECAQCHTAIEHRIVSLTATYELDCAACHQRVHEPQQRLFTGIGGHGTDDLPSSMYLARVSCQSCHGIPREVEGHHEVMEAGEASCLSCHGIRYANILPAWQEEMERKLEAVAAVVEGALASRGRAAGAQRVAADSLLRLAEENVDLVRTGRGAHNIVFSDELLRAALKFVEGAARLGQLDYRIPELDLGEPVRGSVCLRCHLGVERQRGTFDGATFDHRPHVQRASLPCSSCHTSLEEHGGINLASASQCQACHHSGAILCERCHSGGRGAPQRTLALASGDFSHPIHLLRELTCSECHGADFVTARVDCSACHDTHHQPRVACAGCHREGLSDKHAGFPHIACRTCHGDDVAGITEWSRQVCTACHTDRAEHFAPTECHSCHQIPAMSEQ